MAGVRWSHVSGAESGARGFLGAGMLAGMHNGYVDARPVRVPVLVRQDLGATGWRTLHELAELRGRPPRLQVLALVRWALWRSVQGDDTELTRSQLVELLGSLDQQPEAAA